jgi:hypothetical protein
MRVIELDARNWTSALDFYDALLGATGAPALAARNVNALMEFMIWGGMNTIEPPYLVRIKHVKGSPKDVTNEIELVQQTLVMARTQYQVQHGSDVNVSLEIIS